MDILYRPLPEGIRRELQLAAQRTGWTPELIHAEYMLHGLLGSNPQDLELALVKYQESSGTKIFDETEEIELCASIE